METAPTAAGRKRNREEGAEGGGRAKRSRGVQCEGSQERGGDRAGSGGGEGSTRSQGAESSKATKDRVRVRKGGREEAEGGQQSGVRRSKRVRQREERGEEAGGLRKRRKGIG